MSPSGFKDKMYTGGFKKFADVFDKMYDTVTEKLDDQDIDDTLIDMNKLRRKYIQENLSFLE
jgi:hypothetical protein